MNLKIKREASSESKSKSFIFIERKLDKKRLSEKEINEIIKDIVNNSLPEAEISLFVLAMYKYGMNMKETIYLTKAILNSGDKLKLENKLIVDKHSIGGIAGNRTTPIVVSICAAAGLIMPKTSSRAITSAAGTADVIETIAKVNFPVSELRKIIKKTNACMVWGGALGLVPADSKIIKVEKILKIDPEAQLLASIMSKKLAVGSKYILIDIPYGKSAKVTKLKALKLKKKFEYLGRYFKRKLRVILTDGKEPIGNGIGPSLELTDVINILDPEKQGPRDLEKKSLFIAGKLFELTKKAENGLDLAEKILYSGKAYDKFRQIIKAQNGSFKKIKLARLKYDILSKKSGKIIEIDNKKINSLVRMAGSPLDKSSGIYLYFHVGDKIKKREKILTIYSESKFRLKEAIKFYNKEKPIKIK
ncbi:MAG: thymidine phosphorylase [Candidatus Pacearchaeota archaeon]|jgi:putative thymidine phosphorylase|nr:thymidine phosphorylase [Candidatus Pacearchaeota archaeon]|tara:strand:- start:19917 stop:21170 length:1254 start_codon:yes stop_codon:yes gene_type:complete